MRQQNKPCNSPRPLESSIIPFALNRECSLVVISHAMYQQQPAPMGVNPMMGANPFAYGSPMMQPTVPQPAVQQPQMPVAQATPAPAPQTVQQDKVMNV